MKKCVKNQCCNHIKTCQFIYEANQKTDCYVLETLASDAEATLGGVLCKKVFLEISQNSLEKICARVSFLIKLQALGRQLY